MARSVAHVVHDILEAIARVEEITRGKSFEEFEASWQLRWLVERAIEIISEASRAIPDDLAHTPDRKYPGERCAASAMCYGMITKASQTA